MWNASHLAGAKHWHRQKAVFFMFLFLCPQYLSTEPKITCQGNLAGDFFSVCGPKGYL